LQEAIAGELNMQVQALNSNLQQTFVLPTTTTENVQKLMENEWEGLIGHRE